MYETLTKCSSNKDFIGEIKHSAPLKLLSISTGK